MDICVNVNKVIRCECVSTIIVAGRWGFVLGASEIRHIVLGGACPNMLKAPALDISWMKALTRAAVWSVWPPARPETCRSPPPSDTWSRCCDPAARHSGTDARPAGSAPSRSSRTPPESAQRHDYTCSRLHRDAYMLICSYFKVFKNIYFIYKKIFHHFFFL